MGADYFVERRHVAAMAVGRGVGKTPELGGHEDVAFDEALGERLVAEGGLALIGDAVAFEIAEKRNEDAAFLVARQAPGPIEKAEVVDRRGLDIAETQRPGRIERARIRKGEAVERQMRTVTALAIQIGEDLASSRRRLPPSLVAGIGLPGRGQGGLKGDHGRDRTFAEFLGLAVAIEIVGGGPAGAPALVGLDAVMLVEGIDGELPQGRHHALLGEGADDEVGVDALDAGKIHRAVGEGGQEPEGDAFAVELGLHRLAASASARQGLGPHGLQIGRHLPSEKLDEPGTEEVIGAAFVGELRIQRIEIGALETFRDEDIADEAAGSARHRFVVAGGAGIGIGTCQALEVMFDGPPMGRRDDRLGRMRAPRPVERREAGLEEFTALFDERFEIGLRQPADQCRLIDGLADRMFRPGGRIAGKGGGGEGKLRRGEAYREQNSYRCHSAASAWRPGLRAKRSSIPASA